MTGVPPLLVQERRHQGIELKWFAKGTRLPSGKARTGLTFTPSQELIAALGHSTAYTHKGVPPLNSQGSPGWQAKETTHTRLVGKEARMKTLEFLILSMVLSPAV